MQELFKGLNFVLKDQNYRHKVQTLSQCSLKQVFKTTNRSIYQYCNDKAYQK